jgi:HK97 gp10 family phage protein
MPEGVQLQIEGLKELEDALLSLPEDIRKQVLTEAIDAAAEILKDEAKRRAPRVTGKLADSIEVREAKPKKGEAVRRLIGPKGVKYAGFVEYGTAHNPPKPYMRPTHDGRKNQVITQARADVIEGIEELANREGSK